MLDCLAITVQLLERVARCSRQFLQIRGTVELNGLPAGSLPDGRELSWALPVKGTLAFAIPE